MDFKIKKYTIQDLKGAIESDFWRDKNLIPISKHRAISQCKNPNADLDDTALLVGLNDGQIVGIQGMIPDYLYHNEKRFKMAWLSTWWVHPEYRESMLGGMLLLKALKSYQGKLAISGYTNEAGRVYSGSGKFEELTQFNGYKFLLRSPYAKNSDKIPRQVKYKRRILNCSIALDNYFKGRKQNKWEVSFAKEFSHINVELIHQIDEEAAKFLQSKGKYDLFKRRVKEFNWIRQFPWVLSSPLKDREGEKYYFSSVDRLFELYYCKIFSKSELIGFVILQQRNREMSVEYAYFENAYLKDICFFMVQFAIKTEVNTFSVLYDNISSGIRQFEIPLRGMKKIQRQFMISKTSLNYNNDEYILHPGDGNNIFT